MLVPIGQLMQFHCVLPSLPSMGPGRQSLRLAARNLVDKLASTTESSLITPRGFSNVSKVKLEHLARRNAKTKTEEDESSYTSEEPATEEFNLREHALKVDGIKRKLNFCSKSLIVNDLRLDCGANCSVRTRQTRNRVKLEHDENAVKESRSAASLRRKISKPKVPTVKIEKAQQDTKDQKVSANGMVKQEAQEESAVSPFDQHTEIDDIVKREPREAAGVRRRKVQSNVFPRARKVKVEVEQAKDSKEKPHDIEKQASPLLISLRKRKLQEQVSGGSTPRKVESRKKRASQDVEEPAHGLEVVSVRPGSAAQLASGSSSALTVLQGPYPSYARPFPEECQQAKALLSALHGHLPEYERHKVSCPTVEQHIFAPPVPSLCPSDPLTKLRGRRHVLQSGLEATGKDVNMLLALTQTAPSQQGSLSKDVPTGHPRDRRAVLDSLIGTLLSQNTTDNNSRRAFASLKSAFPTWEEVLRADPKEVQDAIRCGGLAEIKAERIRTILGTLLRERGEISMEYIRSMSNEDIKDELSRFKGVGPKTVACVLMFHLQRTEFPVDTHVFRISKMLGWIPESADREKAYLHLNQRIPDSLKFDIHCLFVTHGKRCPKCAKRFNRQPSDGECPLLNWKSKWSSERNALLDLELPSAPIGRLNCPV